MDKDLPYYSLVLHAYELIIKRIDSAIYEASQEKEPRVRAVLEPKGPFTRTICAAISRRVSAPIWIASSLHGQFEIALEIAAKVAAKIASVNGL